VCLPANKQLVVHAIAPLLGLVVLFNAHILFTILFIDAISAPLGTANVYTAVTGRILYGLSRDFFPKSILTWLNKYKAPYLALWLNAFIGICFLLPFPTWKELVDFLSSIVVFSYLAAPVALILLRRAIPNENRIFKVRAYKLVGYLGFIFCSLLIYWSGKNNLFYLSIFLILTTIGYGLLVRSSTVVKAFATAWYLIVYTLLMTLVSYLREHKQISFPFDNVVIVIIGFITCKIMLHKSLSEEDMVLSVQRFKEEIESVVRE
jgi:amino acid transporter